MVVSPPGHKPTTRIIIAQDCLPNTYSKQAKLYCKAEKLTCFGPTSIYCFRTGDIDRLCRSVADSGCQVDATLENVLKISNLPIEEEFMFPLIDVMSSDAPYD